jgi:hypothetical protein
VIQIAGGGVRVRGAIALIEEAVALLRSADAATWAMYLAGSVPFILGLLFFLTDMSRNPFASEWLAFESLGLAALLVWKNVWQALFAVRLYRARSDPAGSGPILRLIAIQAAIQPWSILLQPVSLLLTIPFAWVVAFFRNAGLFAALGRSDFFDAARKQSVLWTRQNWNMLTLMSLAALFVFLNVTILIVLLPKLGLSILGIEGDLSRLGTRLLNPTTLSTAVAITWLVIDPVLEAVYVLCCFYGEAVATGEDLRISLRQLTSAVALGIVLLLLAPHAAAQMPENPAPRQSSAVNPERLGQSIDEVIRQREFAWRLRPPSGPEPEGRWVSWVRSGLRMISQAIEWIAGKIQDWFRVNPEDISKAGSSRPPLEFWMVIAGVVLALGVVIAILRGRKTKEVVAEGVQAAAPAPDLTDESILPDQVPEASWLALAEEWLARGDPRLAMRALYLAGLNYLSGRRLITLERWKTGLDYRRELERRARQNPAVDPAVGAAFLQSVAVFEKGWYGRHPMSRPDVDALARGLEEVRRYAGRA